MFLVVAAFFVSNGFLLRLFVFILYAFASSFAVALHLLATKHTTNYLLSLFTFPVTGR